MKIKPPGGAVVVNGRLRLADLVGMHVLDARGEYVARYEDDAGFISGEDATVALLRLDGTLYAFAEDPNDGYRSSLGYVTVIEASAIPPGALVVFAQRGVQIHHVDTDQHELLIGVDERTGLALFEVGTIEHDDYYPSFRATWTPEGASSAYLALLEAAS